MWRPLILPALLTALVVPGDVTRDAFDRHAAIHARAIPLYADAPRRTRVGALVYRRGWVLSGDNPRFGGISAMTIAGDRVLALSDTGDVIAFTFRDGQASAPDIAPLPVMGARKEKRDRDTESLTRDPVTGTLWVGAEYRNAVWRFAPGFSRADAVVRPRAMRRWPENGGPEALVRLADGRFVVLSETAQARGGARQALLFAGDPIVGPTSPLRFRYRPPAGTNPSDAAQLPDGRVVVLNRHAAWRDGFSAVLTVFDPRAIRAGALIEGRVVARLAAPMAIDNLEALAVTREGGRTMLWIASDDNFTFLQRTLLLKFELAG